MNPGGEIPIEFIVFIISHHEKSALNFRENKYFRLKALIM